MVRGWDFRGAGAHPLTGLNHFMEISHYRFFGTTCTQKLRKGTSEIKNQEHLTLSKGAWPWTLVKNQSPSILDL